MRLMTWLPSCLLVAAMTSVGCTGAKLANNLPPSSRLMHPGPGVGGPGPGVIPAPGQAGINPAMAGGGGAVPVAYHSPCHAGSCGIGGCMPAPAPPTSQISFLGEEPLQISWDVSGQGMFDSSPLFVPGKQNFPQGAIYRLKVTNLPGRETVMLYPTLEVAPVTPRTDAYLAHAPVPVQFTEEDFDQVLSGNFVTKVIYLPDPEFTEIALAGVETLVSTRLDPGVDPIAEADRRGSILAILRMGNKDLSTTAGMYEEEGSVMHAQYDENGMPIAPLPGDLLSGNIEEAGYLGGNCPGGCEGEGYATAGYDNLPMGAPTAGFAPQGVPPHQVAAMAPQWGMPMSGTPIGLPGPPHIPMGAPAGLRKHVMTNRTRVVMPPPTAKMHVSVKQRPGMNYPQPVNHVKINEVNRAPAKLLGGTVPGLIPSALKTALFGKEGECNDCR